MKSSLPGIRTVRLLMQKERHNTMQLWQPGRNKKTGWRSRRPRLKQGCPLYRAQQTVWPRRSPGRDRGSPAGRGRARRFKKAGRFAGQKSRAGEEKSQVRQKRNRMRRTRWEMGEALDESLYELSAAEKEELHTLQGQIADVQAELSVQMQHCVRHKSNSQRRRRHQMQ